MIVTYDHVSFNAEWAARQKKADFIRHESHHGLSKAQLREAHDLCVEAMKSLNPAKDHQLTVGDS